MTVRRHRAQHLAVSGISGVHVDTVEIVACFLGGDGEPRAVDQAAQFACGQRKLHRHVAAAHHREILGRQAAQREPRPARADAQLTGPAIGLDVHLRTVRQFPHDIVECMRRGRGGAVLTDIGRDTFVDRKVHVGRRQAEQTTLGIEQHVGQDRNGIAPLDDALHMRQRLQQGCPFDG